MAALATATIVNAGMMISSPAWIPPQRIATTRAPNPLEHACATEPGKNCMSACSKPRVVAEAEEMRPLRIASVTRSSAPDAIQGDDTGYRHPPDGGEGSISGNT